MRECRKSIRLNRHAILVESENLKKDEKHLPFSVRNDALSVRWRRWNRHNRLKSSFVCFRWNDFNISADAFSSSSPDIAVVVDVLVFTFSLCLLHMMVEFAMRFQLSLFFSGFLFYLRFYEKRNGSVSGRHPYIARNVRFTSLLYSRYARNVSVALDYTKKQNKKKSFSSTRLWNWDEREFMKRICDKPNPCLRRCMRTIVDEQRNKENFLAQRTKENKNVSISLRDV